MPTVLCLINSQLNLVHNRSEAQALFEGCTVLTSPCHQEDILGWNVTLVETLPGILSVLLLSE